MVDTLLEYVIPVVTAAIFTGLVSISLLQFLSVRKNIHRANTTYIQGLFELEQSLKILMPSQTWQRKVLYLQNVSHWLAALNSTIQSLHS
jgi:hypothetical protein